MSGENSQLRRVMHEFASNVVDEHYQQPATPLKETPRLVSELEKLVALLAQPASRAMIDDSRMVLNPQQAGL